MKFIVKYVRKEHQIQVCQSGVFLTFQDRYFAAYAVAFSKSLLESFLGPNGVNASGRYFIRSSMFLKLNCRDETELVNTLLPFVALVGGEFPDVHFKDGEVISSIKLS